MTYNRSIDELTMFKPSVDEFLHMSWKQSSFTELFSRTSDALAVTTIPPPTTICDQAEN